MIVEDFTHVLPEDKPIHRKQDKELFNKIYDLQEANKQAKYYKEFREKLAAIEELNRLKRFKSLTHYDIV